MTAPTRTAPTRSGRWPPIIAGLQVAGFILVLSFLVHTFGVAPFAAAAQAINAGAIVIALLCGLTATWAQAERWRLICGGYRAMPTAAEALFQCYTASFLNSVLPGGVAGDAARAVRHKTSHRTSWTGSIGSVAGERLSGTVIVFFAAGLALSAVDRVPAAVAFALAAAAAAAAWPSLRKLSANDVAAVAALSWIQWAALAFMFWTAASLTSGELPLSHAGALAAICLASMFIPLGVGGWGPREAATAVAFVAFGYPAGAGISAATGYGLLALVSVLPGAVLLLASTPLVMQLRTRICRSLHGRKVLTGAGCGQL
ncbi:lysylphosphatidylglycerol synthase transmembrane domain-containing protein [Arthrobacter castelli]|uniref:lysylphosphatidylglycerol synthase transmembrane domain-containing protein n=1 Tax=Arthrobacter castelli TaxID=271431 RepID=UPI0004175674|nr:lysylphosphatidylglycerol synthase transmembrane domain-containing protein [Arthrobacter castelli]